ncbi:DUF2267 domain-containing protein [Streptomyces sp. NPDC056638]|uniref:DUF2267 domain-containing protein n=1 Tax=Streptomyces sp. NPDC056638 TaxID=3345887 RepID=UPI00369AF48C
MHTDVFLKEVKERGKYDTTHEADRAARVVLALLGAHLVGSEGAELAARLPEKYTLILLNPLQAAEPLSPELLRARYRRMDRRSHKRDRPMGHRRCAQRGRGRRRRRAYAPHPDPASSRIRRALWTTDAAMTYRLGFSIRLTGCDASSSRTRAHVGRATPVPQPGAAIPRQCGGRYPRPDLLPRPPRPRLSDARRSHGRHHGRSPPGRRRPGR